jgi:hypothetical protein
VTLHLVSVQFYASHLSPATLLQKFYRIHPLHRLQCSLVAVVLVSVSAHIVRSISKGQCNGVNTLVQSGTASEEIVDGGQHANATVKRRQAVCSVLRTALLAVLPNAH